MLVDLATILGPLRRGRGIAAFNVFGHEDARAVVAAAEAAGAPVILAASPDFRRAMPVPLIAQMFRHLGEAAAVPVCGHLDHGYEVDEVLAALGAGFTSVMYDGSQRPLAENIAATRSVVAAAHAAGISVEGEVGSVPYVEGRPHIRSELTDRDDAARFAEETGVDALAISVGNVHRLREPGAAIDFDRLAAIAAAVAVPLVIHGTSGIAAADRLRLVAAGIAKFNIGTALRQAFGRGLREALGERPDRFDRLEIMEPAIREMTAEARRQLATLGWDGRG